MEEEKQTLHDVADTILDTPVTFTITRKDKKFYHRHSKRSFKISGATMGTMIKISKTLLDMGIDDFDKANVLNSLYKLINLHGERMAKIIAYAIVNRKEEPPQELINFLLNNLTADELHKLLEITLAKINTTSFLHTIIMAKGIAIVNPAEHRG